MSLNWDVSKVINKDVTTTSVETRGLPSGQQKWSLVTQQLVWYSMSCGFNSITEKNWENIARRIAIMQHMNRPALVSSLWGDIYVTDADVMAHIGLTTNASLFSWTKFCEHVIRIAGDESRDIRNGNRNKRNAPEWADHSIQYSAEQVLEEIHKRTKKEPEEFLPIKSADGDPN